MDLNNFNTEENRVGRGGRFGMGGGGLPQRIINEKYETTNVLEDAQEVDYFNRTALKDYDVLPNERVFEDENTRYDNHSTERLNLRHHGARSEFTPNHPDLFLGFTDKDPRGTQNEPDMRKAYDQNRFRGQRYYKFGNDTDNSIPSSYRNNNQIIKDKDKAFYRIKDALKIFSSSKDNFASGRTRQVTKGKDINYVANSHLEIDFNDERNLIHRGDQTTILSNYAPVGWYRTTDHDFAVAKYGDNYKSKPLGDINVRGAQDNITDDTTNATYKDNTITKALVTEIKRLATAEDSTPAPNTLLSNKVLQYSKMRQEPFNNYNNNIDHKTVRSIVNNSRKVKQDNDFSVARYSAQNSDKRNAREIVAISSSKGVQKRNGKNRRQTLAATNGKETQTMDYSGLTPKNIRKNMDATSADLLHDTELNQYRISYENQMGRDKHNPRGKSISTDNSFAEFGIKDRYHGKMETRANTRNLMSHDYDD